MELDITLYSDVPEADRPKPFYVRYPVPAAVKEQLAAKGWEVRDVRIMSSKADRVRATVEGLNTGTIPWDKDLLASLQLEARIEKLLTNKDAVDNTEEDSLDNEDISAILSFGGPVKLPNKIGEAELGTKKPGRPKSKGLK